MKLLHCLDCGDIVALRFKPRKCLCGKSAGNYKPDGLFAVFSCHKEGRARIIGMLNSEVQSSVNLPIIPFETSYTWFPIIADGRNHVDFVSWEDYRKEHLHT